MLYIDFGRCCKWITSAPVLKEEGVAWGLYNATQYAHTYIHTYMDIVFMVRSISPAHFQMPLGAAVLC